VSTDVELEGSSLTTLSYMSLLTGSPY